MIVSAAKQTATNIKSYTSISLSGIITTSFSVIMLGTFILVYFNVIFLSQLFFKQSHYSIFLKSGVTQQERENIRYYVHAIWGVYDIQGISSQKTQDDFLSSFGESRKLLEKVSFSAFPEIIEFSLKRDHPLSSSELQKIQSLNGVRAVIFGKETKEQVNTYFTIAEFVGFFLIGLLVISVSFIIKNTIQIAIRVRIKEIEIYKILGATKWFIRLPYIFEGIFISLVSSAISIGFLYFLYQFVIAGITFNEATYEIREMARFFEFHQLIILTFSLVGLGVFSSYIATDKILHQLEH